MTSRLLAYRPEMELPDAPAMPSLQQEDELVLAAHLLELQGPAQFDAFLARQLGATVAGRQVRGTPLEGPLRQLLGKVVAPLLPLHGGSPQALKRRAAGIFGMELEGLSPEDKEFELARQVVHLIDAVNTELARDGMDARAPRARVETALLQVARSVAPGLLRQAAQTPGRDAGRWRREGGHIVVLDC
ncbi:MULTISPECIES: hypothetical protein [unclassified Janthinobacterium]|uniref:hypothetical protein n=1 Tax=unclassified Janthinobacterium TaxID=2610881 RepID=UPI001C5A5473|nr:MULTISPECIES: hypothetical protein [unclassified Janthinobacterium]QYG07330.1 hypothetical protein KY494_00385 [Janthinobacterium sp. PAMC25594]